MKILSFSFMFVLFAGLWVCSADVTAISTTSTTSTTATWFDASMKLVKTALKDASNKYSSWSRSNMTIINASVSAISTVLTNTSTATWNTVSDKNKALSAFKKWISTYISKSQKALSGTWYNVETYTAEMIAFIWSWSTSLKKFISSNQADANLFSDRITVIENSAKAIIYNQYYALKLNADKTAIDYYNSLYKNMLKIQQKTKSIIFYNQLEEIKLKIMTNINAIIGSYN